MASEPIYRPDDPHARNPAWVAAHIAFHDKLIDACGSPLLLDICRRLSDAAELYRAWSGAWAEGRPPVRRDIATEHRQLMEAALAHDAELAVQLFEAHVDRTATIVIDRAAQASETHVRPDAPDAQAADQPVQQAG
jgi:DNA-binding GntR family transcriptional regulator